RVSGSAHRGPLAAALAGRLLLGLPDAPRPVVRRPLAVDHTGRDLGDHRLRGAGAVCTGAAVAAVTVDLRGDSGSAAGGGTDCRGGCPEHDLQPAVPQVRGMD